MRALARRGRTRVRGAILIIAMWVLLVLGAVVLVFARSMRVEAVSSANRLSDAQASAIQHAAEQWVLSQVDSTSGDAISLTSIPGQAVQVGNGYFWLLRPSPDDTQHYDFGLVDEASKININKGTTISTTNFNNMLLNVPNFTQEIADSIVDWQDSDENVTGQGGESSYYESLPEPYDAKNAAFETVEELMLVKFTDNSAHSITKDILFGYDLNRDGVIDANETGSTPNGSAAIQFSSGGGNSNDPRGAFNFLTCYTIEPNTDPSGNARININPSPTNSIDTIRTKLQTLMANNNIAAPRIEQVLATVAGRGAQRQFSSIVSWYQASGLTVQEFGPLASYLTTSTSKTLTGLINVNTASRQVLMCLPGMQQGDADSIVSSRGNNSGGISGAGGSGLTMSGGSSNSTSPSGDLTWLFQAVTPQTAAAIAPYITVRSYQYSADIVAVSGDGRAFRRARIVVDARSSPPSIIYRKDLTGYGWPLPPEVRDAMRQGQAPPTIQTAGTAGTASGLR